MHKSRNPSFSSTLLDEIYNSIDPKTQKTQSFSSSVYNTTKKQNITVTKSVSDRKFFGSVSSSSDSNSSIFSSSDTELTHGKKPSSSSSRPLCFGPSKTKPRKTEDKALFHQNRANRVYDDYDYASDVPKITRYDENWESTRTRRSTKSSNKPKTPASPAGRIVNFINSLFSNTSKQSNAVKSYPRRKMSYDDSVYVKKQNDYYHPSTCSSASSFSRSCMNKASEKSSENRTKRSVRFSPVNVIVPEDGFDGYIRKSVKKNVEDGGGRSVEELARDFLRDYHNKNLKVKKSKEFEDSEEDDDDVASDSSSDLFELDLVGNHHHHHHDNVYGDELPVYESTFAGLIL